MIKKRAEYAKSLHQMIKQSLQLPQVPFAITIRDINSEDEATGTRGDRSTHTLTQMSIQVGDGFVKQTSTTGSYRGVSQEKQHGRFRSASDNPTTSPLPQASPRSPFVNSFESNSLRQPRKGSQ